MKKKAVVTYIKNGKEYKKKLNKWNSSIILSKFEFPEESISYIEIDSADVRNLWFDLHSHQTLVFKNCIFHKELDVSGGKVSIIKPHFIYKPLITLSSLEYVNIESFDGTDSKGKIFINDVDEACIYNTRMLNSCTISAKRIKLANVNLVQKLSVCGNTVVLDHVEMIPDDHLAGMAQECDIKAKNVILLRSKLQIKEKFDFHGKYIQKDDHTFVESYGKTRINNINILHKKSVVLNENTLQNCNDRLEQIRELKNMKLFFQDGMKPKESQDMLSMNEKKLEKHF